MQSEFSRTAISTAKESLRGWKIEDDRKLYVALRAFKHYQRNELSSYETSEAIMALLRSWNMARFNGVNGHTHAWLTKNLPKLRKKIARIGCRTRLETYSLDVPENRESITDIFKFLCHQKRIKYTAAAKILFVMQPNLFPMWDGGIRETFGCCGNAEGYLNFMWRMKQLLKNRELNGILGVHPPKLRALDKIFWELYSTSKVK
ncbi:Uncharacterised protein [uncultured archaeon]|nr:Uncharacterised protein [uncultured archaeon]